MSLSFLFFLKKVKQRISKLKKLDLRKFELEERDFFEILDDEERTVRDYKLEPNQKIGLVLKSEIHFTLIFKNDPNNKRISHCEIFPAIIPEDQFDKTVGDVINEIRQIYDIGDELDIQFLSCYERKISKKSIMKWKIYHKMGSAVHLFFDFVVLPKTENVETRNRGCNIL